MFRTILNELLASTRGAVAVVFLDWEGETVDLVCDRDLSDHALRITGAYQGIFLGQLREICSHVGIGSPVRFKVEFANLVLLNIDLKEGYYLVLLLDRSLNEGMAWNALARCRERLLVEM